MNKKQFLNEYRDSLLLLDGATGTNLQSAGMPAGVSPEQWILNNPEVLQKLQESFYESGSSIVYAFTFGANRVKLEGHGTISSSDQAEEINRLLTEISCKVRDIMRIKYPERDFLVAGDLAPTGRFLSPAGDLDFDELVGIYREQVRGQLSAGVDLFVAETMMDLAQTRAAVIAVREESDLPVIASVTVDDNGKTLSGNSFEVCLLSLAAAGAQAVGMNCSSGPLLMAENMKFQTIPSNCMLLAKPNAGVPRLNEAGQTVFDLTPDDFANQMISFINKGVSIIGGCCGTTPEHIAALSIAASGHSPKKEDSSNLPPLGSLLTEDDVNNAVIASQRQTCSLRNWCEWPILNFTDTSEIPEELFDILDDEPGAVQIYFNSHVLPDQDDFQKMMAELQLSCNLPLIFRTDNLDLQKWLVRYFQGVTAIISSQIVPDLAAYYLRP